MPAGLSEMDSAMQQTLQYLPLEGRAIAYGSSGAASSAIPPPGRA